MALSLADKIELAMAKVRDGQQGLTTDGSLGQDQSGFTNNNGLHPSSSSEKLAGHSRRNTATDATDPWQVASVSGYQSAAGSNTSALPEGSEPDPSDTASNVESLQEPKEHWSSSWGESGSTGGSPGHPRDRLQDQNRGRSEERAPATSGHSPYQDPHSPPSARTGRKKELNMRSGSNMKERVSQSRDSHSFLAAKKKLAERRSASLTRGSSTGSIESSLQSKLANARRDAQQSRRSVSVSRATSRERGTPVDSSNDGSTTPRGGSTHRGHHLYDRALETRQSLEKKRQQSQDPECSFRPTLYTRSKSSGSGVVRGAEEGKSRFEMLYENAQMKTEREKARQMEADAEFEYSPAITKKAHSSKAPTKRFELLYGEAQRRRDKLEETTRKLQGQEGCTYKPSINSRSRRLSAGNLDSDAATRLYKKREAALDKERQNQEKKAQRELAECTFSPMLIAKNRRDKLEDSMDSQSVGTADSVMQVESRLLEYDELRKAKLDALRQEQEAKEKKEFRSRPDVSKSQKVHRAKERKGPIHERLSKATRIGEQTESRLRNMSRDLEKDCTFHPTIPRRSASVARSRTTSSLSVENGGEKRSVSTGRGAILRNVSVHDRLYRDKIRDPEKVNKLAEMKDSKEMEECTFTPRRIAADVRKSSPQDPHEEDEKQDKKPAWKRLNSMADQAALAEREQKRKQKLNEIQMEGCTFKPQTTNYPTRSQEDRKVPVHERLANMQPDYALHAKLRESRELEGCTFQPHVKEAVGRDSMSVESGSVDSGSNANNIFERLSSEAVHRQRKGLIYERLKMEKETENCTFQPEVKGFKGIDHSSLAEQSVEERLIRPVEPNLKRAEIEARWRMEQEFRDRHNTNGVRSKSALTPRTTTAPQQSVRTRRTSSRERGSTASQHHTPNATEKRRSASASKAVISKKTYARDLSKQGVAADFDKWQASIEQQINKL